MGFSIKMGDLLHTLIVLVFGPAAGWVWSSDLCLNDKIDTFSHMVIHSVPHYMGWAKRMLKVYLLVMLALYMAILIMKLTRHAIAHYRSVTEVHSSASVKL